MRQLRECPDDMWRDFILDDIKEAALSLGVLAGSAPKCS